MLLSEPTLLGSKITSLDFFFIAQQTLTVTPRISTPEVGLMSGGGGEVLRMNK